MSAKAVTFSVLVLTDLGLDDGNCVLDSVTDVVLEADSALIDGEETVILCKGIDSVACEAAGIEIVGMLDEVISIVASGAALSFSVVLSEVVDNVLEADIVSGITVAVGVTKDAELVLGAVTTFVVCAYAGVDDVATCGTVISVVSSTGALVSFIPIDVTVSVIAVGIKLVCGLVDDSIAGIVVVEELLGGVVVFASDVLSKVEEDDKVVWKADIIAEEVVGTVLLTLVNGIVEDDILFSFEVLGSALDHCMIGDVVVGSGVVVNKSDDECGDDVNGISVKELLTECSADIIVSLVSCFAVEGCLVDSEEPNIVVINCLVTDSEDSIGSVVRGIVTGSEGVLVVVSDVTVVIFVISVGSELVCDCAADGFADDELAVSWSVCKDIEVTSVKPYNAELSVVITCGILDSLVVDVVSATGVELDVTLDIS